MLQKMGYKLILKLSRMENKFGFIHEWSYPTDEQPKLQINELGQPVYNKEEPCDKATLTTWIFEDGSFVPAAKLVGNEQYSIVCDYLGTPVQAYDKEGAVVWECELDTYGKVRSIAGDRSLIPFRYQGQYEDTETGLYYNRFRYYSPDTGTYISQDPIGLAGSNPNLYAYVHDSNTWIDPFGLDCLKPEPGYLRGKKHGIKQQNADAIRMAKDSKTPVGRWGNKTDLEYAGKQAGTLKPGEMADSPINPNHKSVVFYGDGSTSVPDKIRVRNNGNGTFHGFPIDSSTAGPIIQK